MLCKSFLRALYFSHGSLWMWVFPWIKLVGNKANGVLCFLKTPVLRFTLLPYYRRTLLTFLLYVRQNRMAQLILAVSMWGVIFLQSERIPLLICMVWQLMRRKDLFLTGRISRKFCAFLLMVRIGFSSFSALAFPLSITFFVFIHWFWRYFM